MAVFWVLHTCRKDTDFAHDDLAEATDREGRSLDPDDAFVARELAEFQKHAPDVVKFAEAYFEDVDRYPVLARTEPGDIAAQLPATPPRQPESLDMILEDVKTVILPGITHWAHPGFFAYFNSSSATAATLGEWVAAALAVNGMLHRSSPAATELEERVADWLRQMLGLPDSFHGAITDSASLSILMAMVTAREALPGWDVREHGLSGRPELRPLVVYTSEHGHMSIDKAATIVGVGLKNVRKVATDRDFRMDPLALERALRADRASGHTPLCVVATIGTTSASSIDPIKSIGEICKEHGVYFHIDGAYGAMAGIVPEFRHVLDGVELADSLNTNPHKWLFCPLECGAFFTHRLDALKRAFQVLPEYLRTSDNGPPPNNFMDWGPHLSRRFRSLKLWFTIRHLGWDGLADRIRRHIHMARQFATWIDTDPDWERLAPTPLSTVCFRARPDGLDEGPVNRLNEALLRRINETGEVFLSHTMLCGKYTLRLSVGNVRTTSKHVSRAWDLLQRALRELHPTQRK